MNGSKFINPTVAVLISILVAAVMFGLAISRETPVGTLKGTITAQESGAPIDVAVYIRPANVPGERETYRRTKAVGGKFVFNRVPTGTYLLQAQSHWRPCPPIKVTIEEGKTETINVELAPGPPRLDLYVHQHIFTPGERPQVLCQGYVESEALEVRLYSVDLDELLTKRGGNLYALIGVEPSYQLDRRPVDLSGRPALDLVHTFSSPITRRETEGNFTRRINLPSLGPGMYVMSVAADGVQEIDWVMVTSLGLVTKAAGPQLLGFVVDLETGAAVDSADVAIYDGSELVASGKTGSDGLVDLRVPLRTGSEDRKTIVARKGESVAFMSAYLSSYERAGQVIYAYTDRPVYRPGQKVYFRGIVRSRTGDAYTVPVGKKLIVEVRDPNDTLIYRASKITDRFGCYHGEFDLNRESATGTYTLVTMLAESGPSRDDGEVEARGERAATFQVAAYAKPEFSVKVIFPKKRYIRGEMVRAKIKAEYYFGAPVANAKVSYTIQRSDYWFYDDEDNEYIYDGGYEDYGGYGEWVDEGELTTDENGEAVVSFAAVWPEPEEEYGWDNDQLFTVEVGVTDASRREVFGSGEVIATRGEFSIDVEPDRYLVRPEAPIRIGVQARDYRRRPVVRQEIKVIVGREYWTGRELKFRKIKQKTVQTDSFGRASVEFSLKEPGDIRIVAVARDRRGNRITGSAWLWCWSEGYEEIEGVRYPDLKIIPDKKSYNPGETAKILINTAVPGRMALVTIEGERIYERMVILLKGKSTTIDIPVRENYKPNFYVGVCFVRNKQFTRQEERIKVSLVPQTIKVSIQPNKTRYLPGEKATYTLRTTDLQGHPVNAQLSLGVVDEAIYAIRPDTTEPILDYFYYRKPNVVNTQFSFPEIYLSDPDKAGMSAKMLRQTKMRIRKRFLDTAFWKPDIVTGPRGEATVTFTMPDNLTTWRATVRAVTLDTKCGQATKTVIAQQDMLVRLEPPRFLVQDDLTTISAVVHNYTGARDRVDVSFDAPGLTVEGETHRSIVVADQASERIDWTVRATKPGEFLLTVTAKGSRASDAMQLIIPVYPHGEERLSVYTGALIGMSKATINAPVRSDSISEATRLTIRLAPSLASAMLGSLDYLAQYPYGCTEQTVSSFLPDVVLWRSFTDIGALSRRLRAKLPDMVQTGLLRLYRFQMEDGGWGWCEYGKSDPWMTAYVCYGLLQARRAGFAVNQDVLRRGLENLGRVLYAKKAGRMDAETKAWMCYVLALAGSDVTEQLEHLVEKRRLSPRALATVSLAFSELGKTRLAAETMQRLYSMAVVEPAFVHWVGSNDYSGGDIETTALALQAALKIDPKDTRVPKVVAWLMDRRRGNYWFSTRDTAMTLYAMAEFLKGTKELVPSYVAEVRLNGKPIASHRFTRNSIFEPDVEIAVSPRDIRKGRNEITITKIGRGNLYYTATFTQWIAKKQVAATVTGAGVSIRRAYYKPGSRFYQRGDVSALGLPIKSCFSGDVIHVRLTINTAKPLRHLLLEDFIPAGCEIVDRGHVDYWDWDYWYVGRDVRDEKICFYLEQLGPGKYVADYQIRAMVPGIYHAMPAQVFGMYDPAVRATTAESEFEIR